jgi:hypothetical protein
MVATLTQGGATGSCPSSRPWAIRGRPDRALRGSSCVLPLRFLITPIAVSALKLGANESGAAEFSTLIGVFMKPAY